MRVEASYEPLEGSLRITYRAKNMSAEPVWLFNRLFLQRLPSGEPELDPNVVWISIDDDAAVTLAKSIPELPEEIDVFARWSPCASKLAPSETAEETLVVPLPIEALDPYQPRDASDPRRDPVASHQLRFVLGYAPDSEVDPELVLDVPTTLGVVPMVTMSHLGQRLAEAPPATLAVPVIPKLPPLAERQMQVCPSCGTTNVGTQTRCLRCGADLSVPSGATGFAPTHTVPAGGIPAWETPDPGAAAVANLDAGLPVQVLERRADWARVEASNGWSGWVDGRRLVPGGAP